MIKKLFIANRLDLLRYASLFSAADAGSFATIRTYSDPAGRTLRPISLMLGGSRALWDLADVAFNQAKIVGNHPENWVMCSPLATFDNDTRAKTENIVNGLTLSVDLDKDPIAGRRALIELLGEPTLDLFSGGEIVLEDGGVAAKRHLHYQLDVPTRSAEEHEMLALARRLSCDVANGDRVSCPVSHGFRWASAPHMKGTRRRCFAVAYNPKRRINLAQTLEKLNGRARPRGSTHHTSLAQHEPATSKGSLSRTEAWANTALVAETARVRSASKGDRNNALNAAAFKLGQLVGAELLSRSTVEQELLQAARATDLSEGEIASTMKSGLDAGVLDPRKPGETLLPHGFYMTGARIFREHSVGGVRKDEFVCSGLSVEAMSRDTHGSNWGSHIRVVDADGREHQLAIAAKLLAGDGIELRRLLLDQGAILSAKRAAREFLVELIQSWRPEKSLTATDRLGWVDDKCSAFMFADGTCAGDQDYILQCDTPPALLAEMGCKGTIESWRDNVASLCLGNPILIFCVAAALAGALLDLLGSDGGGFHLLGRSSRGKTTALNVAASVWGARAFVQNWNATRNGLEGIAVGCNSKIICLDEISQISGAEAGDAAYQLANGQAKARANATGVGRPRARWRTMLLSSGENSLADAVAEAGKSARAGQLVRLLDIRAADRKFGCFDDLHGREHGAEFATQLSAAAADNYGCAGRAFVSRIVSERDDVKPEAYRLVEEFRNQVTKAEGAADGQVERAARRIGIVYAAGVIATNFGLTGWDTAEVKRAAVLAFELWIKERGGVEAAEALAAVNKTRKFLSRYGSSRFDIIGQVASASSLAGWKKRDRFYITRDAFSEIHSGSDATQAARYLKVKGFLLAEGKHLTRKAPNGRRCFCVLERILDH